MNLNVDGSREISSVRTLNRSSEVDESLEMAASSASMITTIGREGEDAGMSVEGRKMRCSNCLEDGVRRLRCCPMALEIVSATVGWSWLRS